MNGSELVYYESPGGWILWIIGFTGCFVAFLCIDRYRERERARKQRRRPKEFRWGRLWLLGFVLPAIGSVIVICWLSQQFGPRVVIGSDRVICWNWNRPERTEISWTSVRSITVVALPDLSFEKRPKANVLHFHLISQGSDDPVTRCSIKSLTEDPWSFSRGFRAVDEDEILQQVKQAWNAARNP